MREQRTLRVLRGRTPMITVITPAYNAMRFLPQTVASVLAQTFQDCELLIVDDGSTDGTLDAARALAQTDGRVRVVTQSNRGAAAARNLAMRHARGEFFAFLDSDDLWLPSFLAAQMAVFEQYPDADIVTGNAYNLNGPLDGRPLNPHMGECRRLSLLDIIENEEIMCIMSVFRRSVYERIGGLNETLQNSEDYEFWLRAARAGFVIAKNPSPLAHYRRRVDSKSADELRMLASVVRVLSGIRPLCDGLPAEQGAIDRQIARLNQRRLLASARVSLCKRRCDP
jgi:glycosyltransferase involved in cell wall biosynthesis